MNYHNITKDDMLNGEGLRVVLWVSGCDHHCPDCQNPVTWDAQGGLPFDDDAKREIFDELQKDYVSGLTLSGGDPLFHGNRPAVTEFAKEVKQKFPDKTIWLYTGYIWGLVKDLEIMKYIDVVVDGRFDKNLFDKKLHWVGSSNQRVIDCQKSLEQDKIVLHCEIK
ncbi:MAG: anaerobic ribonucleoside-triphosphate reductase activating protein [Corallococcus sp.]|nr:anaerobic ribonucleoside-triphosphate reductase activating protein [Corallococcus sp.]